MPICKISTWFLAINISSLILLSGKLFMWGLHFHRFEINPKNFSIKLYSQPCLANHSLYFILRSIIGSIKKGYCTTKSLFIMLYIELAIVPGEWLFFIGTSGISKNDVIVMKKRMNRTCSNYIGMIVQWKQMYV